MVVQGIFIHQRNQDNQQKSHQQKAFWFAFHENGKNQSKTDVNQANQSKINPVTEEHVVWSLPEMLRFEEFILIILLLVSSEIPTGSVSNPKIFLNDLPRHFVVLQPLCDRMAGRVSAFPVEIYLPDNLINAVVKRSWIHKQVVGHTVFDVPDVVVAQFLNTICIFPKAFWSQVAIQHIIVEPGSGAKVVVQFAALVPGFTQFIVVYIVENIVTILKLFIGQVKLIGISFGGLLVHETVRQSFNIVKLPVNVPGINYRDQENRKKRTQKHNSPYQFFDFQDSNDRYNRKYNQENHPTSCWLQDDEENAKPYNSQNEKYFFGPAFLLWIQKVPTQRENADVDEQCEPDVRYEKWNLPRIVNCSESESK